VQTLRVRRSRDRVRVAVGEIAEAARVRALDDLRCFYFEEAPGYAVCVRVV
jgi:hypothetical protein